jgi:hypothetical protein
VETEEMNFLRAVAGYRMTGHKRKEDIREELGMTDINTMITKLPKEMATTFGRNASKPNP